jgi:flavin reductase (DIM6/NTAB) family NADH-FMN oxidoreductase RutF
MSKKEFGPQPWLFPNPAVMLGTKIGDKVDFATFAWCGMSCGDPPILSVGVRHERYTLQGIYQNHTFSVNVPSEDLVKEADYCGLTSGKDTDKVKDCGFKVFYGTLPNAPLIEQCPVNLECEVLHMLNLGIHVLVVAKIVQVHVSEDCLTEGQPDILKIRPLGFSRGRTSRYNGIGRILGQTYSIGKEMKKKNG